MPAQFMDCWVGCNTNPWIAQIVDCKQGSAHGFQFNTLIPNSIHGLFIQINYGLSLHGHQTMPSDISVCIGSKNDFNVVSQEVGPFSPKICACASKRMCSGGKSGSTNWLLAGPTLDISCPVYNGLQCPGSGG